MTTSQRGGSGYSRRRFLRWTGATGLAGTAGCSALGPAQTPTIPETITATPTPPTSQAEEWPMYLHDRNNTQYNRETSGPKDSVGVAWVFETGGQVRSSPAVVDESVYIGSSDGSPMVTRS